MPADTVAILTTRFKLRPDTEREFTSWQAKAVTEAAGFAGFLNAEAKPPSGDDLVWQTLLRFRTQEQLQKWRESAIWKELIAQSAALLEDGGIPEESIQLDTASAQGGVTEVIVTQVKPGMEEAYRDLETRLQQAQAKFPGYRGSYVQPPTPGGNGWTTLMRFDTPEHLDAWLESPERLALIRESEKLVDYAHVHRMATSFPGWFPTDPKTGESPPNWKAAMLVLLGLFPIVMLEAKFLSPHLRFLNSSPAMFIGNTISVALTTYLTMPIFIKIFGWWFFPAPAEKTRANVIGTTVICILFALEVALLWRLL